MTVTGDCWWQRPQCYQAHDHHPGETRGAGAGAHWHTHQATSSIMRQTELCYDNNVRDGALRDLHCVTGLLFIINRRRDNFTPFYGLVRTDSGNTVCAPLRRCQGRRLQSWRFSLVLPEWHNEDQCDALTSTPLTEFVRLHFRIK